MTNILHTSAKALFLLSISLGAMTTLANAQIPAPAVMRVEAAQGDTQQMTCAQSAAMVKTKGNVVLKSGANHFDLYHRTGATCTAEKEMMQPAFVRTKDNALCFIGYTCETEEGASK